MKIILNRKKNPMHNFDGVVDRLEKRLKDTFPNKPYILQSKDISVLMAIIIEEALYQFCNQDIYKHLHENKAAEMCGDE